MYAIVEIAGKQFKVIQDQQLYTPQLDVEAGSSITFDKVLLVEDGDTVAVGTPVVAGAQVMGKVLDHVRGDKIIVFKKKRRKGYKKTQGHRQDYTRVLIERIVK
ncbi:MAG: 50S ribosomal protein L21 [Amoebophilaceae bacterium]|jgi:large subunit ribosomal protein L21|nr:50S ribosomal protein L21 [Amoebophilaceae bacterium]